MLLTHTCPYCDTSIDPRSKTCHLHKWRQYPQRVCRCGKRKSAKSRGCWRCRTYPLNPKALAIIKELSARLNKGQIPLGQQTQLATKYGVSRQYIHQLANDHVRNTKPGSALDTPGGVK